MLVPGAHVMRGAPSRFPAGGGRRTTDDMTPADLARTIDHTILKPEAMPRDVHRVVAEAIEHGFASVCVAPVFVKNVATMLRASDRAGQVLTSTVCGFPHGTSKPTIKAIEATSAIKAGERIDLAIDPAKLHFFNLQTHAAL